jgi:hypothetical protein
MRILALETSIDAIKEKFVVEGEKVVQVTHRHFMAFVVHIWWQTLVTIAFTAILPLIAVGDVEYTSFYVLFFLGWLVVYAYFFFAAYIQWKYNFLIVTTQKVVVVDQKLFYQEINPLRFSRISNTRVESQFGGFFHCGILHLNLMVPEKQGEYLELPHPYLPRPEEIAAVIENGLVLASEKPPDEKEELEKKEKMQEPAVSPENPNPEMLPAQQKQQTQEKTAKGSALGLGQAIADIPAPPS